MDLVDKPRSEVQATTAACGLAEMTIDLVGGAKTLCRCGTDLALPVAVTDTDIHAGSIYKYE